MAFADSGPRQIGRNTVCRLSQAASPDASDESNRPLLAAEAAQFSGVVDEFPFEITADVMQHGRNRYMIYCVVCHDAAGTGLGKIVAPALVDRGSRRLQRGAAEWIRAGLRPFGI